MLTDQETLGMKSAIIEEIATIYEKLLTEQKIDEARAREILDFVKEKIQAETDANAFSKLIFEFCAKFQEFASIAQKVKNMRNELLEKVGQECLENLMERKMETWSELTSALEKMTEVDVNTWFSKLPPETQARL